MGWDTIWSQGRRARALLLAAMAVGGGVAMASVGAAGDDATSAAPSPPTYGGHLTVSGEAEVSNPWTPAAMRCDSYCYVRARTFFDQVAVAGQDGAVHGWLAESIEPNADFTQWTVTLRPGITFTDGTPLDAAAVIYNLQAAGTSILVAQSLDDVARVADPDDPSRQILKIEQLDDLSFVIYTGRDGNPDDPLPWADLPIQLTGQWGLIASPTWLEAAADDPALASQPVGSGPFVVDSYAPREKLEVVRNPDYWATDADGNQLPYLDGITFRVIEDPATAFEAIESGDVDLLSTSSSGVINDALAAPAEVGVSLQDEYTQTYYLMMDLDKAPFDDERVRCALAMSIDRDEIVDAIGGTGVAVPANGVFSPGQQGYLEDNGFSIEPDPDTARGLIEDYEADTGEEVTVTIAHTPANSVNIAMELVQGYWSDIGVDVELRTMLQDDLINMALFGAPEYQIVSWRSHDGIKIDQQHLWWISTNAAPDGELALNLARVRDPDIDAGLETARTSTDPAEALAAAESVNRAFADHCYNAPLLWLPWAVISQPGVAGVDTLQTPEGDPVLQSTGMFWTQTLSIAES